MLYGRSCVVLFYETFNTSYTYTRIGAIDDPTGLADALGTEDVVVKFELEQDVLVGDLNGDREVSVSDISLLINYILMSTLTPDIIDIADINGDREVTVGDVSALISLILS